MNWVYFRVNVIHNGMHVVSHVEQPVSGHNVDRDWGFCIEDLELRLRLLGL
jgi:hypothetical protein